MSARILHLDIERIGALKDEIWEGKQTSSWIGPDGLIEPSRTVCFAYRWEHERSTKFVAEWDFPFDDEQDNTSPTPGGGHREMILRAWELLNAADYVVGWNSKAFDMRHLRAGFFAYGLEPPSPWVDLDLMVQGDREFFWPSKSLAYVSKLKGHAGKIKLESGIRRKLRFATGDELVKARAAYRKYNIRDVDETRALFHDMRPWLKGMNLALFNNGETCCPVCESTDFQRRGDRPARSYVYPRYQCNKCGKWFSGTKMFRKAEVVGA